MNFAFLPPRRFAIWMASFGMLVCTTANQPLPREDGWKNPCYECEGNPTDGGLSINKYCDRLIDRSPEKRYAFCRE